MKDAFAPMVKHSVPPVSRTAANEKGENHNYIPPPPSLSQDARKPDSGPERQQPTIKPIARKRVTRRSLSMYRV
jgi:hypothetical protein